MISSAGAPASAAAPPASAWRRVGLPVVVSGASVACATACTNPLDVLKVRLQVLRPSPALGSPGPPPPAPRGMGQAFVQLVRGEGVLALWKGLTPSLARAVCYGGLRLGLYQPIARAIDDARTTSSRRADADDDDPDAPPANPNPAGEARANARGAAPRDPDPASYAAVGRPGGAWEATGRSARARGPAAASSVASSSEAPPAPLPASASHRALPLSTKIAAGCASGAFAAALLNPTELIKTRLMADARTADVPGPRPGAVRGPLACAAAIVRERGVAGLWRGVGPSAARSAILTASQCATYDGVKTRWMAAVGWSDGLATHLAASMLTGLVTTTVTNPADMIKTQMYVVEPDDARGARGGGARARSGAMAAARRVVATHGWTGLMRGWSANYVRLGPQTVITFVALEKFRALAGMQSL